MDFQTIRQALVDEWGLPGNTDADRLNRMICQALKSLRPEVFWFNLGEFSLTCVADQREYALNVRGGSVATLMPYDFWGFVGDYLNLDPSGQGTRPFYEVRAIGLGQLLEHRGSWNTSGKPSVYALRNFNLLLERPPNDAHILRGHYLRDLGTPVPKYTGSAWQYELRAPGAGDVDQIVDQAWQEDNSGSSFVDITADLNDAGASDAQPFPAGSGADDAVYFGFEHRPQSLVITTGTAGAGSYTVTWEYWNSSSWAALNPTDGTGAFKEAGQKIVSYSLPAAWATTTVNGSGSLYYIRARRDSGTVTTDPLLSVAVGRAPIVTIDSFTNAWFEHAEDALVAKAAWQYFTRHGRDALRLQQATQAYAAAVSELQRDQGPLVTVGELEPWMEDWSPYR